MILSDAAKSDMDSILEYTLAEWRINQMLKYEQLFIEALSDIKKDPLAAHAQKVEQERIPTRYYRVEKHHIYYTIENNQIYVMRILHGQMDADLHL